MHTCYYWTIKTISCLSSIWDALVGIPFMGNEKGWIEVQSLGEHNFVLLSAYFEAKPPLYYSKIIKAEEHK